MPHKVILITIEDILNVFYIIRYNKILNTSAIMNWTVDQFLIKITIKKFNVYLLLLINYNINNIVRKCYGYKNYSQLLLYCCIRIGF